MSVWGERVRRRLREIGMPQHYLSTAIGVSQGAMSMYLSGKREISLVQFATIARILDVSADWLLSGEVLPLATFDIDEVVLVATGLAS